MSHLEYPWDVLNIEPTTDKKIIKKAYAALLKKYKPDEFPEEFQEIQEAYKVSLKLISKKNTNNADKILRSQNSKNLLNLEDKFQIQNSRIEHSPDVEREVDDQNEISKQLFEELKKMAFESYPIKVDLKNWQFLNKFYEVDDLNIKQYIAQEMFKQVAEYNLYKMRTSQILLIPHDVLTYFNEIFDWESKWNEYQNIFPSSYINIMFSNLGENTLKERIDYYETDVFEKIKVFFVEMCFIFLFTVICLEVFDSLQNYSLVVFSTLYLVNKIAFSLWKNTECNLGMFLNKVVIVDKNLMPIRLILSLFRNIIFYSQFSPILIAIAYPQEEWWEYLLITIVSINLVLILFKKCLLHDFITKSRAVKYRKEKLF